MSHYINVHAHSLTCMQYHALYPKNNKKYQTKTKPTQKSILIAMSDLFLVALLSLLIFSTLPSSAFAGLVVPPSSSPSSASAPAPGPGPPPEDEAFTPTVEQAALLPFLQPACNGTRNPPKCLKSLAQSNKVPKNPTSIQVVEAAIWVSFQDLKVAQTMVQNILNAAPPGPPSVNLTNAAQNSVEYFKNAEYRMRQTVDALHSGKKKDARAWLTAAEVYQYDVWSALKYVNNTPLINQTMAFTYNLINLTSNALAMTKAYDVFGDNTKTWQRPVSERDGFWEKTDVKSDSGLGQYGMPPDLKPDVTVCKGPCTHQTIQEAVDAGPSTGKRFVILIKAGIYDESVRVPLVKKNMIFLGEGMGKTIITGAKTVTTPGVSTYNTATVGKNIYLHLSRHSLFISSCFKI